MLPVLVHVPKLVLYNWQTLIAVLPSSAGDPPHSNAFPFGNVTNARAAAVAVGKLPVATEDAAVNTLLIPKVDCGDSSDFPITTCPLELTESSASGIEYDIVSS